MHSAVVRVQVVLARRRCGAPETRIESALDRLLTSVAARPGTTMYLLFGLRSTLWLLRGGRSLLRSGRDVRVRVAFSHSVVYNGWRRCISERCVQPIRVRRKRLRTVRIHLHADSQTKSTCRRRIEGSLLLRLLLAIDRIGAAICWWDLAQQGRVDRT